MTEQVSGAKSLYSFPIQQETKMNRILKTPANLRVKAIEEKLYARWRQAALGDDRAKTYRLVLRYSAIAAVAHGGPGLRWFRSRLAAQ